MERKSWRCPICGLQTSSYGITSHKIKEIQNFPLFVNVFDCFKSTKGQDNPRRSRLWDWQINRPQGLKRISEEDKFKMLSNHFNN